MSLIRYAPVSLPPAAEFLIYGILCWCNGGDQNATRDWGQGLAKASQTCQSEGAPRLYSWPQWQSGPLTPLLGPWRRWCPARQMHRCSLVWVAQGQ